MLAFLQAPVMSWAADSYITGFDAFHDVVRNDDGKLGADDNVIIVVDIDDGGVGKFFVTDHNGPWASVNTIVSDAQSTTVSTDTAGYSLIVANSGTTIDGGLSLSDDGISNAGAVSGVTTLSASGLASLNGGIAVDTSKFTVNGTTGAVHTASTLDAAGSTTVGTGASTTNTFGAGATSNNTIGNAGTSTNIMTGATNTLTGTTSSSMAGANSSVGLSNNSATLGVTAGSTVTATNNLASVLTADGGGLTVNNAGTVSLTNATASGAGLNISADGDTVSLLNDVSGGHGLSITANTTTLSGGTNSSTWTLADAQATLGVGTATDPEVTLINATNDGINTSVIIGDATTGSLLTVDENGTRIGDNSQDGTLTIANNANNNNSIQMTGSNGTLKLGNTGEGGDINVVNDANTNTFTVAGQTGTVAVGNGTDTAGILNVANGAGGQNTIVMDGDGGTSNSGLLSVTRASGVQTFKVDGQGGAANSALVTVADGSANAAVTFNGGNATGTFGSAASGLAGTVNLTNTAGTNIVSMKGAGSSVIANGVSLYSTGTAAAGTGSNVLVSGTSVKANSSDAATNMTLDDGTATMKVQNTTTGNWHGVDVNQTRTVLSGGTNSTTLTLDDNGATFANESGSPARVTGVADGSSDYDAVNYKQLKDTQNTAYAGIASVAALTSIPQPVAGKKYSIGGGWGNFKGHNAGAVGGKAILFDKVTVTAGVGIDDRSAVTTAIGAGWSF